MFNRFRAVFMNNVGDEYGFQEPGPSSREKPPKYRYSRPEFLNLTTEDLVQVTNDHKVRPIIVPREPKLPWFTGYAECINAGKSVRNEDQAYAGQFYLRLTESQIIQYPDIHWVESTIPYTYFALFDGHAGYGASVAASHELHTVLHSVLCKLTPMLLMDQQDTWSRCRGGVATFISENSISNEQLIMGALEEAFHLMDARIRQDKLKYSMPGGCTALVTLFILGKVYVANAGDTRAVMYKSKIATQVSNDFTPETESYRIRQLAATCPHLLGGIYATVEYNRRPRSDDVGKSILFRDYYMTGWSLKTVTDDDTRPPIISGEGKRSRLLSTIGVTRGFGDHELRAVGSGLPVKPFLSSQPEVKILDILSDTLTRDDVIIMATDGLWDVISNEKAGDIVQKSLNYFGHSSLRYICAAQDLVMQAKGKMHHESWKLADGRAGTVDDVSVFVIPILPYHNEFTNWRENRDCEMHDGELSVSFGKLALKPSPARIPLVEDLEPGKHLKASPASTSFVQHPEPGKHSKPSPASISFLERLEPVSIALQEQKREKRPSRRSQDTAPHGILLPVSHSHSRSRRNSLPKDDPKIRGRTLILKRSKSHTDIDNL